MKKRSSHAIAAIIRDGEAIDWGLGSVTLHEIERHRKLGIPFKAIRNGRAIEIPVGKLEALERKMRKARSPRRRYEQ